MPPRNWSKIASTYHGTCQLQIQSSTRTVLTFPSLLAAKEFVIPRHRRLSMITYFRSGDDCMSRCSGELVRPYHPVLHSLPLFTGRALLTDVTSQHVRTLRDQILMCWSRLLSHGIYASRTRENSLTSHTRRSRGLSRRSGCLWRGAK